jgi:hypothetical protein
MAPGGARSAVRSAWERDVDFGLLMTGSSRMNYTHPG